MLIDIQSGENLLLLSEHHAPLVDSGRITSGLSGIKGGLRLIDISDEIGECIKFARWNAM